MSTVQPTDKVLVNRAGTDYSATADTLMATIQDTDLLLVNRAGVDYKCSGLDFKASMKPPESVDKPSITSPSNGAGQPITPESDEITNIAGTVITVKTNKDLGDFVVGSLVTNKGVSPIRYGVFGSGDKYPSANSVLTLLGAASLNTSSTTTQNIPDNPHPAGGSEQLVIDMIDGSTDATIYATGTNWRISHSDSLKGPWVSLPNQDLIPAVALRSLIGTSRYVTVSYTPPGGKWSSYSATITLSASWVNAFTASSSDTYAEGKVVSTDPVANTITLTGIQGTWKVGQRVYGPTSLSADAALGKNPTFTSSAFSGTNGATHVSTDWQVTTKADTGFAAIVTQSMADTTNKVSWTSGDLAADTDYIARVRYHSAGAVSPWSDVIGFKTGSFMAATRITAHTAYGIDDNAGGFLTGQTAAQLEAVLIARNYYSNNLNDANKNGNKGIYLSANGQYIELTLTGGAGSQCLVVLGSMNNGITNCQVNITGDCTEAGTSLTMKGTDKSALPKFLLTLTADKDNAVVRITSALPTTPVAGSTVPNGKDPQIGFYYISNLPGAPLTSP